MGKRLQAGDTIPAFCYDTPHEPQKSFYELAQGEKPLIMVFLRNFGHPITRHFITQYLESMPALRSLRLVCVVQSRPEALAQSIQPGMLPFELMCDAEQALYDYFDVQKSSSILRSYSLEALKIVRSAQKEGYRPNKNEVHQLPLTLIVGPQGKVLFRYYGTTVTDLPPNCEAMEGLACELGLGQEQAVNQDYMAHQNWQSGFENEPLEELTQEQLQACLEQQTPAPQAWEQPHGEEQAAPQEQPEPVEPVLEQTPEAAPRQEAPAPQRPWQQKQTQQLEQQPQPDQQEQTEQQEQPDEPQDPQEPQQPQDFYQVKLEPVQRPESLPMGKVHYPQNHSPKRVDFSALGFDGE